MAARAWDLNWTTQTLRVDDEALDPAKLVISRRTTYSTRVTLLPICVDDTCGSAGSRPSAGPRGAVGPGQSQDPRS